MQSNRQIYTGPRVTRAASISVKLDMVALRSPSVMQPKVVETNKNQFRKQKTFNFENVEGEDENHSNGHSDHDAEKENQVQQSVFDQDEFNEINDMVEDKTRRMNRDSNYYNKNNQNNDMLLKPNALDDGLGLGG